MWIGPTVIETPAGLKTEVAPGTSGDPTIIRIMDLNFIFELNRITGETRVLQRVDGEFYNNPPKWGAGDDSFFKQR